MFGVTRKLCWVHTAFIRNVVFSIFGLYAAGDRLSASPLEGMVLIPAGAFQMGDHLIPHDRTNYIGFRLGLGTTGQGACGNGVVESGEQCDDGNADSGDGCSATCQREGACCIGQACTCPNTEVKCNAAGGTWHAGQDCSVCGSNLLVNGDFESGNCGFSSDLAFSGSHPLPTGSYIITTDPHDNHSGACSYGDHTSGNSQMFMINAWDWEDPGRTVWSETVAVLPGVNYVFSGWISAWNNGSADQFRIYVNSVPISAPFTTAPGVCGAWENFFGHWLSETGGSVTIEIRHELSRMGSDFAFDDFSMRPTPDAIPTVSFWGLVAMGLVIAAAGSTFVLRRRPELCGTFI